MYGDCPRANNIFGSAEECEKECMRSEETSREFRKGHGRGTKPGRSETQHKKQRRPSRPIKQKPTSVGKQRPTRGSEENEAGTSSESEKGHGGTQRPTKSGGQHHPKRRPTKPTKGRPGGGTKLRAPSSPGHSLKGTCGARPRRGKCEENSGMWYNDADFYTCSRVREGMCPTGGSFFESCEDCMRKCRRHMLKTCAYKT
ncbi:uncharacterized protein LOC119373200 isoform X2 [Rhipicephalus sanguineus]|uniref:uncharacterized protein LOC119373200 isoform X2 n=1 Tax=Rhipicephalus sanguineus TaxID=34632 RepID=UPI0018952018|nr:uncharacterized protein LOC119373200 isoform X2 [Rhipicephalus sanguineus]